MKLGRSHLVVLLLAAGGGTGCHEEQALRAYGSVEARQVRLATRTGGPVAAVLVEEGDHVEAGQVLVRLDLTELEAQRAQAAAALQGAAAREQLVVEGARSETIVVARKAVSAAQVRLQAAERELTRATDLRAKGAVPQKALDDARTAKDLADADLVARRAQLEELLAGARKPEVQAAAAARAQAEAALALIDDRLADREIESPLAGVVLERLVEPGEIAPPGGSLLVLGDLDHPYVDVYVPTPHVGEVLPGMLARVSVDALPDERFDARVAHVASEAEFTPKNVQTAEQRARLVFRARVDILDPRGLLIPGMPAEAVFRGAAPESPPRRPTGPGTVQAGGAPESASSGGGGRVRADGTPE